MRFRAKQNHAQGCNMTRHYRTTAVILIATEQLNEFRERPKTNSVVDAHSPITLLLHARIACFEKCPVKFRIIAIANKNARTKTTPARHLRIGWPTKYTAGLRCEPDSIKPFVFLSITTTDEPHTSKLAIKHGTSSECFANSLRFDTPELRCLLGSQPNIHLQAARLPIQPARWGTLGMCLHAPRRRITS